MILPLNMTFLFAGFIVQWSLCKFKNFPKNKTTLVLKLIDDLFLIVNEFYYLIHAAVWNFLSGAPAIYGADISSVSRLVPHQLRPTGLELESS